ncbi:MAG: hydrogenase expression/formation protein HypE [Nitratiruptor sp.]|nr:hydrogenase expression/formation protein HypE [Nitratiruptor sp.]NPA84349.1 hydrogenase expression/formation protein HypE [Campylobacterota bacterium]
MITLAMGNGGVENRDLIEKVIFRHLGNDLLAQAEDGTAIGSLPKAIFTTDSFTISPLFFPGGDIGKLAVAGACNDLAMMGARPKFLSCSFIIEEGFSLRDFQRILRSMAKELSLNQAQIVTGDTKVVPKGSCDGLYINISAIGEQVADVSQGYLKPGLAILISGSVAKHGAAIFAAREGIELQSDLMSDCKSLWPVVEELLSVEGIKAMRDATRGGVAAVLNEWARAAGVGIEIDEGAVPVTEEVRGICEMLGFEPLVLANEGTFVVAVEPESAPAALEVLRRYDPDASLIGRVQEEYAGRVVLRSQWGTRRFLDMPSGEILPRIC